MMGTKTKFAVLGWLLPFSIGADGTVNQTETSLGEALVVAEASAQIGTAPALALSEQQPQVYADATGVQDAADDEAVESPPNSENADDADTAGEQTAADDETDFQVSSSIEEVVVISRQQEKSDRLVSRVLASDELFRIPALRDDVLGAINTYAAVANLQSSFNGPPTDGFYFRGGNLRDNHFEIDGLGVSYIYHLGGPFTFSVINGRLVDRLKFYASNPNIDYPNVSGGVIEVALKQPSLTEFNQEYDIGTLSAGAMIEGGFGNGRDGYWLAVRRSYIDFFLNAANIGNEDDSSSDPNSRGEDDGPPAITRFPEFYDIQGRWYRELDAGFMDLTFIVSRDRLAFRLEDDEEDSNDPKFAGELANRRSFIVLGWRYQYEPSNENLLRTQLNFRFPRNRFVIGTQGEEDLDPGSAFIVESIARAYDFTLEHTWRPVDKFGLRYGLELTAFDGATGGYIFRFPSPDVGIPSDEISTLDAGQIDETVNEYIQEVFFLARYQPSRRLVFELGARTHSSQRFAKIPALVGANQGPSEADSYFSGISPRLHLLYELGDNFSLYYRWGDFLQRPTDEELNVGTGNPTTLDVVRSRGNLLGANLLFEGRRVSHEMSFELWHRDLRDLIIPAGAECVACYGNTGVGTAYGFDFEWSFRGSRGQYFRIAYSWLTTIRRNGPNMETYPSAADQPHTLKLLYSGPLSRRNEKWRWGIFITANSGQPFTPVVDRQLARVDNEVVIAPVYGSINSERFQTHMRINFSISYVKADRSKEVRFSLLSLQQAFRQNETSISYGSRYQFINDGILTGEDFLVPSIVAIFRL